ncbi:MAG: ARMT1-like domain-containing protein [Anaerolineales bacterium]|nr:ARMT1-like domain-containing protein [Anaerolineales bacterium]
MKTYPECYTCIFRQAVTAVKLNCPDQNLQIQTLQKVLNTLAEIDDKLSPSAIAGETNRVIRESIGVDDLYQADKISSHKNAIRYFDDLRTLLKQSQDPLEQGLKISAAGNIIDIIHANDYDLWEEVETTVSQELQGEGLEAFRKKVNEVPHLLYLADNVGETVFDRVFIESLDIPVVYAVKSGPVLNDATLKDALAAGIDQVAQIVETGSWAPGTILYQSSDKFQQLFKDSPLVLSKGQANYETLDEQGEKVFFLLRVKCPVLSERLNVPLGNLVLKQGNPLN